MQKVILEIRAGTGGDEAAIFAGDLARMYGRYATIKKWGFKKLDSNTTPLGGYKSFVAEVIGEDARDELRYESGVHRVQRIPKTERSGRVHTSTASVAVIPEVKPQEIEINPNDLELGTFVRKWLIDFMVSAPLVRMIVQGIHAVDMVRKIVGPTMPYQAEMGTIRGDYSADSPLLANKEKRAVMNLVHASETSEEAAHEIEHWFGKKSDVYKYKRFGVDD